MTTTPDPKTVREIAREFLLDNDLGPDELDYVVRRHINYTFPEEEFQAWREAVDADAQEATVTKTASWPDEQPQDGEIAAELVTTKDALNAAYRERAHLVALLAAEYPSHIGHNDPFAPDWAVVTVELPTGQACWHISADDMDLFEHVPPTPHYVRGWDGHTTNEKYRRIRKLAADTYTRRVAGTEAFLAAVERYEAEQPQDERDKRSLVERLSGDDAERVAALIDERDCWRKEVLELRAQVAAQAEQPQDDGDVRAVAPELRREWGVQVETSARIHTMADEAQAREIAATFNRIPETDCHYVVMRLSTGWQRPPDIAALEARDAKPAARERVAELAEHAEEER